MSQRISRGLLALSGAILLLGALIHTRAFPGADAVASSSNMPRFYSAAFRALWLIDSTVLVVLGLTFALFAAKPAVVVRPVALLLTIIPFGTAAAMYTFIGSFVPAHMVLSAAILAVIGVSMAGRHASPVPR